MITKEQLLFELINFSSLEKPLNDQYFIDKYPDNSLSICHYAQQLKILFHDLQCDQIDSSVNSIPFYLIFENEAGFYIAKTREGALNGNQFYLTKIKALISVTSNFNKMTNMKFPEEDTSQLNLL